MDSFPACKPLIPRLRKPGVVVEEQLAEIQAEAITYPERHRQLTAIRYYLRQALWQCENRWKGIHHGITNYATLLDEIERWRLEWNDKVCFVTFNYDTMLEEAMAQVLRLEVLNMDSYRDWGNYSLFKLHGSIDWGRIVEGVQRGGRPPGSFYQQMIDTLPDRLLITGRYTLCTIQMHPKPDTNLVLFPALSIPVQKKDVFECPLAHIAALEANLPHVTKMMTIGWRATEAEFLNRLVSYLPRQSGPLPILPSKVRSPKLLIVSGSDDGARETAVNLARYGVTHSPAQETYKSVDTGFTGLITHNLATLRDFLRTS